MPDLKSGIKPRMRLEKREKVQKIILLLATLSQVMLAIVVFFLLINGLTDYEPARFLFETQSKFILALLAVSMTCFLFLFYSVVWNLLLKCNQRLLRIVSVIFLLAAIILQFIFLLYYRSSYLFDSAFVAGGASSLAETGSIAKEAEYYLSVYPNQNAFTVLTMVLWKLGRFLGISRGNIPLLLNGFNMICLDTSVVLFFLIVKYLRPSMKPAKWTFLIIFMVMNPFLYIGVSYYYTITISMPFFMLILYFYVRYLRKKEYKGYWIPALTGTAFAIGYLIRPTTVIPLIAVLFCLILFGPRRKKDFLILVTALVCIVSFSWINRSVVGLDTENTAFPTSHWIMMSLTPPGSHNEEDEAYTASFPTKEAKKEADLERMKEKLKAMGGKDFLLLMTSKLKNTWGCGSNGYTVYLEHCLRTDGLYTYVFGDHRDFIILYHQGYYLLLLAWILFEIIQTFCIKNLDITSFVLQLTFLGGILFYLLWETSAQYSLPFLFVLMFLAASGIERRIEKNRKEVIGEKVKLLLPLAGAICFIFLCCFFIRKAPVFTKIDRDTSIPVVSQLLANEDLELEDGEGLTQSFITDQPFNEIIFQWRNPNGDSDAVYKVIVSGQKTGTIVEEKIIANGLPYSGASVYDFSLVKPNQKEKFTINIYKAEGSEENNLKFVTYSMGKYDPYPFGSLKINGKSQTKDMLLSVAERKNCAYTSVKKYYVFVIGLLLLYLLLIIVASKQVFRSNTSYN